jgi:hypothetical protein
MKALESISMVNFLSRGIVRRAMVGVGLAASLALAGCSHHTSASPGTVPVAPAIGPAPIASPPSNAAAGGARSTGKIAAYKIAGPSDASGADANGLAASPIDIPPRTVNPPKYALVQLTTGPNSPLPRGTRVLRVTMDRADKLATVDFSRQFRDNFHGGETREAQAIESVLETLGQFPDVEKVQILVDGHKIDSIGGSQELDEPLPTPQSGSNVATIKGA